MTWAASLLPRISTGVRYGAIGTWFNATKGFGFIQPDSGGNDVFVRISAVERAGLSTLNEGAKVSYEEQENGGRTSAENLRLGYSLAYIYWLADRRRAYGLPAGSYRGVFLFCDGQY